VQQVHAHMDHTHLLPALLHLLLGLLQRGQQARAPVLAAACADADAWAPRPG
jgi:hypothetical protein